VIARRGYHAAWLAVAWLLPFWCAAAPVPAKVELQSGQSLNVQLLRRDDRGWVFMRQGDSPAEIGMPGREFKSIEFNFNTGDKNPGDLYSERQYNQLTPLLVPIVQAVLPYLDLPNNMTPWAVMLLRCHYWRGEHQELRTLSHQLERLPDPAVQQEARAIRALSFADRNWEKDARKELDALGDVPPDSELAAVEDLVRAKLALADQRWSEAQEQAARVVAFHAKRFDWLPPALYVSALAQAGGGATNTAVQILHELELVAPGSAWSEQARTLSAEYAKSLPQDEPVGDSDRDDSGTRTNDTKSETEE
jgi:hypothetical protein